MAVLGQTALTLAEWAKRLDSNGKIPAIVEMLEQQNEILMDMKWKECNNGTNHKTIVRTGLPTATWRKLNYGVANSKSSTASVSDATGMLEVYAEVDKALADLNGNASELRLSEDKAFIAAMNNEAATAIFYGDTATAPEKFMGLSPRFNALSGYAAASNIISMTYDSTGGAATAAKQSSIWLVVWGDDTCHGIFPKGSKAGLQHQDLGEQTIIDSNNLKYQGYRSHYKWDMGLTVRDWRQVVRICNIDIPKLTTAYSADYCKLLVKAMIDATERIENGNLGTMVFYANRVVRSALRNAILEKIALNLTWETIAGKQVLSFDGIPVRRCDALLTTEAILT